MASSDGHVIFSGLMRPLLAEMTVVTATAIVMASHNHFMTVVTRDIVLRDFFSEVWLSVILQEL